MENQKMTISLNLDEFIEEGLYLIFSDSFRIEMTKKKIESLANEYWTDPDKIPDSLKRIIEFQPCDHCPEKGNDVLCNALKPILPFIESVDRYMSFDQTTAIYRGNDPSVIHVSHTTMQQALRYLSVLSLVGYCEMGDRYKKYFSDINPLMKSKLIASRLYSNIYLENEGNQDLISSVITDLKNEVRESIKCLMNRLRFVCKNDAFLNAYVNTQIIMDTLDSLNT
jgi:hypothetical protein